MKKIFLFLAICVLPITLFSCSTDNTPVISINDVLKISAYVYNEDGKTWGIQTLHLNEPKELVPTYVLQDYEDKIMVNFNIHFEYEDGICIMSAPNRDMQLSVGKNGGVWKRGEDMSTRVYDFQNNYELTLSRPGYMAVAMFGMKNRDIYVSDEVAPFFKNFEAYIGQEYYLTVKACNFDKVPVITAQLKFTSLEDDSYTDGTSRYFSIELVSYEYSDFYRMMEDAS